MKTLREELEEILDMGDDVAKEMDITIKGEPTVKVDYIKAVLSRHTEEETLAVVARRKGFTCVKIWPYMSGGCAVDLRRDDRGVMGYEGKDYHEAEAKARKYLEGLEDK